MTDSSTPGTTGATVLRSEERLIAGVTTVPSQRVVVRKVVVEEERTITVTVRHEELRVDRVDLGPGEAPTAPSTALPLDLVLHEEQVEVVTSVVPTERVHVDVRRVAGERTVTDEVRRERVEVDGEPLPLPGETTLARHRR